MATEYEVSISCRNLTNKDLLSKSDPVVILLENVLHTKRFVELARTELVKDCLNPSFATKFRIKDVPEEDAATLRVAVIDIDDFENLDRLAEQEFIGRAEFNRSQLFANPTFSVSLSGNSGHVTFKTVRYDSSLDGQVTLQFANHDFRLKNRPAFLEIYRLDHVGSDPTLTYRSEQTLTGNFEPAKVSLFSLALGNKDCKLRMEIWRYSHSGDHKMLAARNSTLLEIERLGANQQEGGNLLDFQSCKAKSEKFHLVIKQVEILHQLH